MLMSNKGRPARLHYMAGTFRVLSPGDHVICAVSGAKIFDFGIGDQDYKRRWCRTETPHIDILYPVTPLGQLAAFGSRLTSRFKRWVKNHPQLYGIIQRLRSAAG